MINDGDLGGEERGVRTQRRRSDDAAQEQKQRTTTLTGPLTDPATDGRLIGAQRHTEST